MRRAHGTVGGPGVLRRRRCGRHERGSSRRSTCLCWTAVVTVCAALQLGRATGLVRARPNASTGTSGSASTAWAADTSARSRPPAVECPGCRGRSQARERPPARSSGNQRPPRRTSRQIGRYRSGGEGAASAEEPAHRAADLTVSPRPAATGATSPRPTSSSAPSRSAGSSTSTASVSRTGYLTPPCATAG